ncbi:MAG: flavodoxin family protein [Bacteroidales bacterium]|nr:flavodoxin family protein [Bacteroidales bacterium]
MKKAYIIYESHTGITKKFAEEIGKYLESNDISTSISSIKDIDSSQLNEADAIWIGCWTSGFFFFGQHPNRDWKEFADTLPNLNEKKMALFTTYKLATGSMFRKMEKKLSGKIKGIDLELKSKNGNLSDADKEQIKKILP